MNVQQIPLVVDGVECNQKLIVRVGMSPGAWGNMLE